MTKVQDLITYAQAEIGKPYVFGDEGPNSFDCSGLMQWVYAKVGLKLPRTAAQQQAAAKPVSAAQALPGDLVFWGAPAHHVGLYIGGGKMIAAPHSGAKVRVQDVYGTPTYGRVAGLGTSLANALSPGDEIVGELKNDVREILDRVRGDALQLAAVMAGLALVGLGLWRISGPARARWGGGS